MKPHTIGEELIHPACASIVRTMFGNYEEEIKKIPLSDVKITLCPLMLRKRVSQKIKESNIFALQVDESMEEKFNISY
jgi:hypothetical protein